MLIMALAHAKGAGDQTLISQHVNAPFPSTRHKLTMYFIVFITPTMGRILGELNDEPSGCVSKSLWMED